MQKIKKYTAVLVNEIMSWCAVAREKILHELRSRFVGDYPKPAG